MEHKQGQGQDGVPADVMTALRHRRRKGAAAIKKITDGIMLAGVIVTGGKQQRGLAAPGPESPSAKSGSASYRRTNTQQLSSCQ